MQPGSSIEDAAAGSFPSTRFGARTFRLAPSDTAQTLFKSVQWDKVLDRALDGLDLSSSPILITKTKEMWDATKAAIRAPGGLIGNIIDNVAKGGSFEFLDVRTKKYKDGKSRTVALFRLIKYNPKGFSCNDFCYYDFVLDRQTGPDNNTKVVAVDVYDYLSGEDLSESFHRDFLVALCGQLSDAQITKSEDKDYLKSVQTIGAMNLFLSGNDFKRVKELYSSLPPTVRADESVLILYLQAASRYNDSNELSTAYDMFKGRTNYADPDPAADLIAMDGWVRMKDASRALDCLAKLESGLELTKPDPYVVVVEANIYAIVNNWKMARERLNIALETNKAVAAAVQNSPFGPLGRLWYWMRQKTAALDQEANEGSRQQGTHSTADFYPKPRRQAVMAERSPVKMRCRCSCTSRPKMGKTRLRFRR